MHVKGRRIRVPVLGPPEKCYGEKSPMRIILLSFQENHMDQGGRKNSKMPSSPCRYEDLIFQCNDLSAYGILHCCALHCSALDSLGLQGTPYLFVMLVLITAASNSHLRTVRRPKDTVCFEMVTDLIQNNDWRGPSAEMCRGFLLYKS